MWLYDFTFDAGSQHSATDDYEPKVDFTPLCSANLHQGYA